VDLSDFGDGHSRDELRAATHRILDAIQRLDREL
jgi:hypothetical protein